MGSGGYANSYRLPHSWWINVVFYALIGWIVGRVTRRRQAAIIGVLAASIFVGGVASLSIVHISVDMVNLSYHLAFRWAGFDAISEIRQAVLFNVVVIPLVALIAGLSARWNGWNQSAVA